jgi:hypothetical protein
MPKKSEDLLVRLGREIRAAMAAAVESKGVKAVDACWPWQKTKAKNGYGRAFLGRENGRVVWEPAHRMSFEWHFYTVPKGKCVCHSCDNKACINPYHLFLGSHGDNMADRNEKQRQARGESHGVSKLNDEVVRKIRRMHGPGMGHKRIAKELGVNKTTVSRVLSGKTWRHVK